MSRLSGLIKYLSFFVWLSLLNMFSRFILIQISMCQNFISFQGWIISIVCINHIVFIHLLMQSWVVCTFWLCELIVLWMLVCRYLLESLLSAVLGICLGVELLGHRVIPYLTLWGISKLISTAATLFFMPTSNVQGLYFLHTLANTCSSPPFFLW